MKKLPVIVLMLILPIALFSVSYGLWRQNAEVRFRLTISQPAVDYCPNCTYDTIQEGIDLHEDTVYPAFYDRMDSFKRQLKARAAELNALPFGGISYQELSEECDHYRNVDIAGFGTMINAFGTCINRLSDFYNNSSQEQKAEVPDFWAQQSGLWSLSNRLWDKRSELYAAVDQVWEAGREKIDWNKKN